VVIRPNITGIGATDFEQKNQAILEGERAALAPCHAIKAAIAATGKPDACAPATP
jgi:NTE family protein